MFRQMDSHVTVENALVAKVNEFAHVFHLRAEVKNCGKTCVADGNHQWLGVSLSRQPGDNGGHVLVINTLAFLSKSRNMRLHVFLFFLVRLRCTFNAFSTNGRRKCCKVFFSAPKSPFLLLCNSSTVSQFSDWTALSSSQTFIRFKYKRLHRISLVSLVCVTCSFSPRAEQGRDYFFCLKTISKCRNQAQLFTPAVLCLCVCSRTTDAHKHTTLFGPQSCGPGEQQRRAAPPCFCH